MKLRWIFLSLFLSACSHHGEEHSTKKQVKTISISEYGQDFTLPQRAWDLLLFEDLGHEKMAVDKKNDSTLNTFFSEIEVEFTEKTPGVLKYPHFMVQFPKGGGTLDLSQYRTNLQGTYYVKIHFARADEATDKKVIFISGSKKRRLGSLVVGSGCNVYFNITDKFYKNMKENGIEVNTTRHRDVSLLAGHFVFYAHVSNQNYISQVQFQNTNQSYLECGESHEPNS